MRASRVAAFALAAATALLASPGRADDPFEIIATLRGWIGENGTYDFVAVPQRGLDGSSGVIVRWDPPKGTWSAVSRLGGSPIR